jgi:hypothetical protein
MRWVIDVWPLRLLVERIAALDTSELAHMTVDSIGLTLSAIASSSGLTRRDCLCCFLFWLFRGVGDWRDQFADPKAAFPPPRRDPNGSPLVTVGFCG